MESGSKKKDVAKTFGIPQSTLSTILKNKERVLQSRLHANRKRFRDGEFPGLEDCLVKFLGECRAQNIPVGGSMLKEKAISFAEKLGIKSFNASEGWLTNFKRRQNIVFKKICGESASVDPNVCSAWKDELAAILADYDPHNVFNTDETGLFFKCLPDSTFTFKDEKCHGGKHSKERITVLLTANMDGSQKLTPLVIGKAANPRCFKGIKSFPTSYKSNKKAWMTTELFNNWLLNLERDMKRQKRKIILFLDNCTVHNNAPNLENVTLQFFPPNTTSKLQPLDQGVIQNFKTLYRKEIVRMKLDCIETGASCTITVLTAMNLIHKAWNNVTNTTIANCFKSCGFGLQQEGLLQQPEEIEMGSLETWHLLPEVDNNCSFNEYVHFDDHVAVFGSMTDEEILASSKIRENDDENEDEDDATTPAVTSKMARQSLCTLRQYLLRTEVDENVFSALVTLENAVDHGSHGSLKQKTIVDFLN